MRRSDVTVNKVGWHRSESDSKFEYVRFGSVYVVAGIIEGFADVYECVAVVVGFVGVERMVMQW